MQPIFEIHLHEKDLALLIELQKSLGGIGGFHKGGKNSVHYYVSARKELSVILAHFDKYPLRTQKLQDYLLFRSACLITSQGPLDLEKLQKLVNIRASLNKGLTPALREAFPLTVPVDIPKRHEELVLANEGDSYSSFSE